MVSAACTSASTICNGWYAALLEIVYLFEEYGETLSLGPVRKGNNSRAWKEHIGIYEHSPFITTIPLFWLPLTLSRGNSMVVIPS